MSIRAHTYCDNCEAVFALPDDDAEFDELYELTLEDGWVHVEYGDEDNRKNLEFCSPRCLAVWAVVNAGAEIGLEIPA